MPDNAAGHKRLSHTPFLSSDELIVLLEENVEDFAFIVTNPERQIINWSKGAEHLFGYTIEEVLGKDAAFIFTSDDRNHQVPEREFQTAQEKGHASDERWHLCKDGSQFWASGSLTALREANGTLRGAVKIVRDLTERKRFEDALRIETENACRERERAEAAAQEAVQLNSLLRRAMAEAHHRIKNSFQMLSALVDVQQGNQQADTPLDYTRFSLHIRALSAIHDLLTQDAKTTAEFDYVNAKSLLEKIVLLIQQTLQGVTIRAEIEDVTLPLKQATALAPLVSEMVANAVKHGRGDVAVMLSPAENTLHLAVCDSGPGFPDGFNPKTSAHTGLELMESLARHDLRGDIRYENQVAGGAQVTVTFPVSLAYQPSDA